MPAAKRARAHHPRYSCPACAKNHPRHTREVPAGFDAHGPIEPHTAHVIYCPTVGRAITVATVDPDGTVDRIPNERLARDLA